MKKIFAIISLVLFFAWPVYAIPPSPPSPGGSGTPYDSNPEMNGSVAAGNSDNYARGNHVHPSDTSRVATTAIDTDSTMAADSDSKVPSQKATKAALGGKISTSDIDTDSAMAADSDSKVPSQKAVKAALGTKPGLSNDNPQMDGVAAAGDGTTAARSNHVHPSDTSRMPFSQAATTLTANSATPALTSGKYYYVTANTEATTYTNFTGGAAGQRIIIKVADNNSVFDFTSTNLVRAEGTDYTAVSGDVIDAIYDGSNWYCRVWGINAPDGSRKAVYQNNTSIDPAADAYETYFDNGVFKINENGVEHTASTSDRTETLTNKTLTTPTEGFAATGLTAGKIYYLASNGTWTQADAIGEGTYPARCFAVSTTFCAYKGLYTASSHGKTVGATLYLTDAAGDIDTTASTTNVQSVGFVYDANTYWINISPDYGTP